MKSNNQYLKGIANSESVNRSDNYYLKQIARNTGSNDTDGHHSDNYYLKRINENMENGGGSSGGSSDVELDLSKLSENGTISSSSFNQSLISISVPNGTTSLGNNCFYGCSGLESLEIPSSVTSLGIGCFYGCSSLVSLEIPSSVTSLGSSCFGGCINLSEIVLNWNASGTIVKYNNSWSIPSTAKFSIPNGTTSLYTAKSYPSDRLVERE